MPPIALRYIPPPVTKINFALKEPFYTSCYPHVAATGIAEVTIISAS